MKTYGLAVDDELAERIDEPLEYGDSRSERIRDLVEMGLEAEELLQRYGSYPDTTTEKRALVRQCIMDYYKQEGE